MKLEMDKNTAELLDTLVVCVTATVVVIVLITQLAGCLKEVGVERAKNAAAQGGRR